MFICQIGFGFEALVCNTVDMSTLVLENQLINLGLHYRSGKGIHLLIIISGQGEKLETKLGLQGEMEK
jgi:hypothetical protein